MKDQQVRLRRFLQPEALFTAGVYLLLLALFSALRLLLLWRGAEMARQIPAALLAESFWAGIRCDLEVGSRLLIPFYLLLLVLRGRGRRWLLAVLAAVVGLALFSGLAEIVFCRNQGFRLGALLLEAMDHPGTIGGALWKGYEGYPPFGWLLVWALLFGLFGGSCVLLYRRILRPALPARGTPEVLARTMGATVMLVLMIFASRGGIAHEPPIRGDAFISGESFADSLARNGALTLGRSILEKIAGVEGRGGG